MTNRIVGKQNTTYVYEYFVYVIFISIEIIRKGESKNYLIKSVKE